MKSSVASFFAGTDRIYNAMMAKKPVKLSLLAAALGVMVLIPQLGGVYFVEVMWNVLFYMILALALNIIVGYTGLCDLGFSAKIAIGAYTTAILMKTYGMDFWLTLPISMGVSALAAVLIGAPTLKLRSDYLAVVTLGFAEIVRITATNLKLTGAASGISGIPRPTLFGLRLAQTHHWYYIFLVLLVAFILISYRLRHSRFGRGLAFVREDEDAAQAMGINTTKYKLLAYVIGAVLGGLVGSFYAVKMTSVAPGSFDFNQSVNILLAVILGGMGKIPGVILGAAFFAIFPELFRSIPLLGDMRMLIFGVLLIVVMITRPQGLWPSRRKTRLPEVSK